MMGHFFDASERTPRETIPGVQIRTWWGERMLLSLVDLAPKAHIPAHSHPHEQIGIVIRGEMTMTIGDETHLCGAGTAFVVPGGVAHSVEIGPEGAQTVETFAPVREEYKFPN